jgi:hypothetical protein
MKKTLQAPSLLTLFASSAALGALMMFAFDPSKGRRRRALLRDKTRRSITSTAHALQVSARDLGHRARGLRAAARHLLTGRRATDDLVLIERVRAKMGRIVSHPHAIQIGAHNGRVTLSGPILPGEAGPLLETVRSVWGVRNVEDHLVVYDRPDSIPSLQGGVPRNAVRAENARHEWRPVWRIAALCAAGALALCATRSRGAARLAFVMAGASLATRGTANMPLARLARPLRRARNGHRKPVHAFLADDRMHDASESTVASSTLH